MTATKSRSQIRSERTLATRRRVVGAAYRLFCEQGYVATTMEAIAREADIALPTLYFTFRTKGAILGEALGAAVMGFDEPVGPEDSAWYGQFQAEPDARLALRILVENTTPILRRVGPLLAATYAAANDPEVASVYELGEQRRHDGYRAIVQMLARKGGLRPGIRVARATDILLVLLGPQLFDALANGRGWSVAACNRWIVEVLSQQLLTPSDTSRPPGARSTSRRATVMLGDEGGQGGVGEAAAPDASLGRFQARSVDSS